MSAMYTWNALYTYNYRDSSPVKSLWYQQMISCAFSFFIVILCHRVWFDDLSLCKILGVQILLIRTFTHPPSLLSCEWFFW